MSTSLSVTKHKRVCWAVTGGHSLLHGGRGERHVRGSSLSDGLITPETFVKNEYINDKVWYIHLIHHQVDASWIMRDRVGDNEDSLYPIFFIS